MMGEYLSLACADSPCECRITFGQHKGNKFVDLSDDYLPLARSYTLSREMNMYPKLRDAIVSHVDREIARRAAVAEAARLEERAREFDKVYADALDMPIDDLLRLLDERGLKSPRIVDDRISWQWYGVEEDERTRLRDIMSRRVIDVAARLRVLEREAIDADMSARFDRWSDIADDYTESSKRECWPWRGRQTPKGLPKTDGMLSPARIIFEYRRMFQSVEWDDTRKVCADRLCVNPWHRLTPDETAKVITLGLVQFFATEDAL